MGTEFIFRPVKARTSRSVSALIRALPPVLLTDDDCSICKIAGRCRCRMAAGRPLHKMAIKISTQHKKHGMGTLGRKKKRMSLRYAIKGAIHLRGEVTSPPAGEVK